MSTTGHLALVARLEARHAMDVLLVDQVLYGLTADGLACMDVSIPSAPRLLSTFAYQGVPSGFARVGHTVWIAERAARDVRGASGAVHVVDVSNPTAPKALTTLELPGGDPHTGLVCMAGRALVPLRGRGVALLDVAAAVAPRLDELILDGQYVSAICGDGSVAFISHDGNGSVETYPDHYALTVIRANGSGRLHASSPLATGMETRMFGLTDHALLMFDGNRRLLVVERERPDEVLYDGPAGVPLPTYVHSAGARAICFHPHGAWAVWGDAPGPVATLVEPYVDDDGRVFEQYTREHRIGRPRETTGCARRGNLLYAAQHEYFCIYEIGPGSLFAGLA